MWTVSEVVLLKFSLRLWNYQLERLVGAADGSFARWVKKNNVPEKYWATLSKVKSGEIKLKPRCNATFPVGPGKKPEKPALVVPSTPKTWQEVNCSRSCPYCAEDIKKKARYCKHCHSWVSPIGD